MVGPSGRGFTIHFDDDGRVTNLDFAPPGSTWTREVVRLSQGGTSYLVFDPFELREWDYLAWNRVPRSAIERLLGAPFDDGDFVPYSRDRVDRWLPPGGWPECWDVTL